MRAARVLFAAATLAIRAALGSTVSVVFAGEVSLQPQRGGSPCQNISEDGCVGGYPAAAALMRALASRSDANVTIGNYGQDRVILTHPRGLALNDDLWTRAGACFQTAVQPSFLAVKGTRRLLAQRLLVQSLDILSTNLELCSTSSMVFAAAMVPMLLVEPIPGIKIAFIWVYPAHFWYPAVGFAVAGSFASLARDQGASAVVALTGVASPDWELHELAKSGVDVALFTTLDSSTITYDVRKVGDTWMVRRSASLQDAIGSIDLRFGANRSVEAVDFHMHSTNVALSLELQDARFREDQAIIQQLVDEVVSHDKVFAVSTSPMPEGQSKSGLTSPCRDSECPLGTLAAKALAQQRNDEIVFFNGGGLRDGWDAGDILRSELTAAVPFQNFLCHLNLTAANILRALEHGVSTITAAGHFNVSAEITGQYLQVHGLRYTVNPSLPPYGRVTGLEVPGADGTWVPIDMQRPYKVATVNFLCDGGDGFTFGANAHNGVFHQSTVDVWGVLVQHMTDLGKITPHTLGLIVYDFDGETLQLIKKMNECTVVERYLSEWEVCEKCTTGFYNPRGSREPGCIPMPKTSNDNTAVVVIATVATVMLVCLALALGVRFIRARELLEKQKMRTRFAPKSGLCAIVFTDITQATELWELFPSEMETALATHDEIARELMEECEGYEVKTLGDSFMVAFEDPVLAVDFMMRLQTRLLRAEWPEAMLQHAACRCQGDYFRGLRVRCGCHVGPAVISETHQGGYDYTGTSVNLASRVSDCGEGGQVIITERTYQMIEPHMDALPESVDVRYLGDYSFKGILNTVACYQILPDELAVGREPHFASNLRHAKRRSIDNEAENTGNPLSLGEKWLRSSESPDKGAYVNAVQRMRRWVLKEGTEGVLPLDLTRVLMRCQEAGSVRQEDLLASLIAAGATASRQASQSPSSQRGKGNTEDGDTGRVPWSLVQDVLMKMPREATMRVGDVLMQERESIVESLAQPRPAHV